MNGQNQRVVDDWPTKRMDMNPAEHVWAKLGIALRTECDASRTFGDLKDLGNITWERVYSRAYFRQLTDHHTPRLAEVVEMRGGVTK